MYLFDVPRVIIRGFEDERLALQGGVEGDALHRVHADVPLAELLGVMKRFDTLLFM